MFVASTGLEHRRELAIAEFSSPFETMTTRQHCLYLRMEMTRADYLEGTVQDGDFWVDAAIAVPGAELKAKREVPLCVETLRNGEVRHRFGTRYWPVC